MSGETDQGLILTSVVLLTTVAWFLIDCYAIKRNKFY